MKKLADLLAAGVLFVVGFALASLATWWFIARLAVAFILGIIPILYIYIMKSKRLAKFEEQLPEALDMMARSLRAGHAFTGALQMVGQEFDEPLGPEFTKTLNEINYGLGSEMALRNLVGRIDSDDREVDREKNEEDSARAAHRRPPDLWPATFYRCATFT